MSSFAMEMVRLLIVVVHVCVCVCMLLPNNATNNGRRDTAMQNLLRDKGTDCKCEKNKDWLK